MDNFLSSTWWGDILFLSCSSVRHTVVHITRKFWSPEFCGSYAPLNLEISQNLLLKQLVSATPPKLLNRISWNLVGSKDTICSCAYYQKILIAWSLWELCPFEHRNFPKIYYCLLVIHITRKFCGSYAPLNLKCFEIYFWSSLSAQLLWNYWTEFHETW